MDVAGLIAATRNRYHIEERWHACAVLSQDFPSEFQEIIDCLNEFELVRSEIAVGGGGKTRIARRFDEFLVGLGWREASTSVKMTIGEREVPMGTHKVDLCKGRIAVEVEWNNKDPFFSRDLSTFRQLHELNVISVGVIITRADELQDIFRILGVGGKYGASTTHWSKLMPLVNRDAAGTCPLLLIAIAAQCYRDDLSSA